jgi:hypothetical protein
MLPTILERYLSSRVKLTCTEYLNELLEEEN